MKNLGQLSHAMRAVFAAIVIPLAVVIAWAIYAYILGNPDNFVGGSSLNEPLKNNYLGVIYKGGPIVILLIAFQIILITYVIERFLTISKASGWSHNRQFVRKIKAFLAAEDLETAMTACDRQQGSVANVVKLNTFKESVCLF